MALVPITAELIAQYPAAFTNWANPEGMIGKSLQADYLQPFIDAGAPPEPPPEPPRGLRLSIADYLDAIAAARSQAELDQILATPRDEFNNSLISWQDYMAVYDAYVARGSALDKIGLLDVGREAARKAAADKAEADKIAAALAAQKKGASPWAWSKGEFEATHSSAAWLSALGLPAYGQNPFQSWMASQAVPAYKTWQLGELMNSIRNPKEYQPKEFTPEAAMALAMGPNTSQPGGVFPGGHGQAALQNLRGLGNMPVMEQELIGEEMKGEELGAILQAALGPGGRGYASPIAQTLAERLQGYTTQWEMETRAGQQGTSFIDYILSKYGMK